MKRTILLLMFLLMTLTAYAWDSTGHRLIAVIAYSRLTPAAKQHINRLTQLMFRAKQPEKRFLSAAVWPDRLRADGIERFNALHFINLPYVKGNIKAPKLSTDNVVTAIIQAEKTITSSTASPQQKAEDLSFLIHFVGDAHQPMHCIQLYSKQFPHGDYGGNRYFIRSRYADNLHSLWDKGVGAFYIKGQRYPLRYRQVIKLAAKISKQYPPDYFKQRINQLNPTSWVENSYHLAKRYAYNIRLGARPGWFYRRQGQRIARQQIALAGYQLAAILNKEMN